MSWNRSASKLLQHHLQLRRIPKSYRSASLALLPRHRLRIVVELCLCMARLGWNRYSDATGSRDLVVHMALLARIIRADGMPTPRRHRCQGLSSALEAPNNRRGRTLVTLRGMVLRGEIPKAARIEEVELARTLGVSQPLIRRALEQLDRRPGGID